MADGRKPSISFYVERMQTSPGARAKWNLWRKIYTGGEMYTAELVREFKTKSEADKARREADIQETIRARGEAEGES